jgi:prolipoprotein diacylglyceryltransferase
MYLLLYGLVRFGVEFLRMHDASNPLGGPLTLEQWLALAVAAAGAWLVFMPRAEARQAALSH